MRKLSSEVRTFTCAFVYSDGHQCRALPRHQSLTASIIGASSINFGKPTGPATMFPNMSPTTSFPLRPATVLWVACLPPLQAAALFPKPSASISLIKLTHHYQNKRLATHPESARK